jgi:membrane-associated protease RseP (regulator of RpoE activity)
MNNRHNRTEYVPQPEQSTYQTGSTKPPKSYRGLILFLLGLVIFLGGIATALGFTNVQLFKALHAQEEQTPNAVDFASQPDQRAAAEGAQDTGLGFSGETVSEFWHNYHELPRGVFIQSVDAGSQAALQGILPGDILVQVDGVRIDSLEQLQELLLATDVDTVTAVLHRDEGEFTVQLPVAH